MCGPKDGLSSLEAPAIVDVQKDDSFTPFLLNCALRSRMHKTSRIEIILTVPRKEVGVPSAGRLRPRSEQVRTPVILLRLLSD